MWASIHAVFFRSSLLLRNPLGLSPVLNVGEVRSTMTNDGIPATYAVLLVRGSQTWDGVALSDGAYLNFTLTFDRGNGEWAMGNKE